MTDPFADIPVTRALQLAAEHPFAWIVPAADPSAAILMPVLFEDDGTRLLGHLPRRADATRLLADDPRATFLFLGPHAYIPPAAVRQPGWAPTWNFVALKTAGTVTIDPAITRHAVESLVQHMEGQGDDSWGVERIGPRYDKLLAMITGFTAAVDTLVPRFKTGQDETPDTYADIRAALEGHPLAKWMDGPPKD